MLRANFNEFKMKFKHVTEQASPMTINIKCK